MNLLVTAAELLSRRLGLSLQLLGNNTIERALDVVFANVKPEEREPKATRLLEDQGPEWQMLVDEVVVPETWFFRHSESFQFLASYVTEKWKPANLIRPFQVLCIPCASGEEPYSIVMALLHAGLDARRIRVDAADVSERLLARARLAVYGKISFREEFGRFQKEYFVKCEEGWRVREEVVRLVHFEKANLLDLSRFRQRAPYDAIFCRNVLIYLDERARHEVVSGMRDLLHEEGLLFTGPPELVHFCQGGYVPVHSPHSFACRKGKPGRDRAVLRSTTTVATTRVQHGPTTRGVPPPDAKLSKGTCPPPEPPPDFEQAERLAGRGELDAAATICERLLQDDPRNPDVYALLGVITQSGGNVESAEKFFRKALYLAPDHYESLLHMSLLCERRGDDESARLYRARAGRSLTRQEGSHQVVKNL